MKKTIYYTVIVLTVSALFFQCNKEETVDPVEEVLTGDWVPPIGIPRPSFGIEETYRMYDDSTNRNTELTYTENADGGFYTHYVDNTDANATDTDNPYGTKEKPRASLPKAKDVAQGSVVEIHGGPYTLSYTIYTANGTKEEPIFMRGYSETERSHFIDGALYLNCQYFIFENIERTKSGISIRSFEDNEAHHVGVRNCEVHDCEAGISAVCYDNGEPANNVVIYKNHIHPDNFNPDDGTFPENDVVGVYFNPNTNNIWIIDNEISHAAGDGVGGGHGVNYTAYNYYVGRNIIHTCGENAVDLKEVENIVISQNIMYNFYGWSGGSQGCATVVHYGPNVSPKNVWFLYNEIYDCNDVAIQVGGDQEFDVHYIGNIIHDISNSEGTAKAYRTWSSRKVFFINNTIYNCDNGIDSRVDGSGGELYMYNNIISNMRTGGFHLQMGGSNHMANSEFKNNLYYQGGSDIKIDWGGHLYSNIADFQTATSQGVGSIVGDPMFTNPAANDFSLQSGSAAIDKATEHDLNEKFQSFFGVDIKFDYIKTARPQNGVWDIGAYEYK